MSDGAPTALPPLTLSFMGANYVGRVLGYGVADEWGPYDVATKCSGSASTSGPVPSSASDPPGPAAHRPWS